MCICPYHAAVAILAGGAAIKYAPAALIQLKQKFKKEKNDGR